MRVTVMQDAVHDVVLTRVGGRALCTPATGKLRCTTMLSVGVKRLQDLGEVKPDHRAWGAECL